MKVNQIMQRDVASLRPEDNAFWALHRLFEKEISGLPVIDQEGRLAGMFTEKDVLRFILPSYVEKVGRFIYEENPKSIRIKFTDLAQMQVAQLMRKEVVTTTEEVTLCEVARLMLTQKARRIPVIDKANKVVGIVARSDVLSALAKEAGTTI